MIFSTLLIQGKFFFLEKGNSSKIMAEDWSDHITEPDLRKVSLP